MTEKLELPDGYVVVCVHCAKELNIECDEQKPLSEDEIYEIWERFNGEIKNFARAIEERHGIK